MLELWLKLEVNGQEYVKVMGLNWQTSEAHVQEYVIISPDKSNPSGENW